MICLYHWTENLAPFHFLMPPFSLKWYFLFFFVQLDPFHYCQGITRTVSWPHTNIILLWNVLNYVPAVKISLRNNLACFYKNGPFKACWVPNKGLVLNTTILTPDSILTVEWKDIQIPRPCKRYVLSGSCETRSISNNSYMNIMTVLHNRKKKWIGIFGHKHLHSMSVENGKRLRKTLITEIWLGKIITNLFQVLAVFMLINYALVTA